MEFDTDGATLGKHRIKLRSTKDFPTELMHPGSGTHTPRDRQQCKRTGACRRNRVSSREGI